jgi:hypothetical protein
MRCTKAKKKQKTLNELQTKTALLKVLNEYVEEKKISEPQTEIAHNNRGDWFRICYI